VGIPVDWKASQTRRTIGLLGCLNVFCLIFMVMGCLLDRFKVFVFDPKVTEKKAKEPVKEGEGVREVE